MRPKLELGERLSELKRTSALLRQARSVQRRLDGLRSSATAAGDPSLDRIAEAADAVDRVVVELSFRERGERRQGTRGRTGPA